MLLEIRRESDGFYFDFNDTTFKNSGWTTRQQQMAELNVTNSPGTYFYNFDTTGLSDDNYYIRATSITAYNTPWESELKVGDFVDNLDTTISSRASETNATSNKNEIIVEIDANEVKIDSVISDLTAHRTAVETRIIKILGLSQSNYRFSNQVYDANNSLTSGKLSIYPTSADTDADTNVIATYIITATYDALDKLTGYKVTEN